MIVCAAIKTAGKVWALPRPARHHNVLELIARETGEPVRHEEQGFLACSMCYAPRLPDGEHATHGLFLRRAQAEHHASVCGQLKEPLIGSILTSEDLW